MTKDELRAKHPELFQSVIDDGHSTGVVEGIEQGKKIGFADGEKAGAEKERQRIKDVRAQALPGHEALVEEMVADGKTTGAEAAIKILAAEKGKLDEMAKKISSSAVAPVPPVVEPEPAAQKETFEAAVDRLVAGGLSKGKAIAKVAQDHPDLHQDYIARFNKRAE